MVKILQAVPDRTNEFAELRYHYTFTDIPEDQEPDDFIRQKKPQYMFQVPDERQPDSFYISGNYRGVGSVQKFYKRNAALRWHAKLDSMTRVNSIAIR